MQMPVVLILFPAHPHDSILAWVRRKPWGHRTGRGVLSIPNPTPRDSNPDPSTPPTLRRPPGMYPKGRRVHLEQTRPVDRE